MNFQALSDNFLDKIFLPFIPHSVTPNQVTYLRIFSLPFIYFFFTYGFMVLGFTIFLFAAITDALDGAIARKRNQITETGKILDPLADRALIFLVVFMFLPKLFGWEICAAIIFFDIFNSILALKSKIKLGINKGANWAGKIKMIIQCFAFIVILFHLTFFPSILFLSNFAYGLLIFSLAFSIIQSFDFKLE